MRHSRRHFLRSAGVTIGLPFLSSLASANSNWPKPPSTKRMVFVSTGLGMHPDSFFPTDFGLDFTPSPTLKPMMRHKGDFTVFSRMDHPQIHGGHGGPKSFLNGLPGGAFKSEKITSVDQVAAHSLGYVTRYPSLHIGVGGRAASSYSESGIRLRPEGSPQQLFKKLFVNDSEAAKKALAVEIEEQGSVLDLVKGQAKMLERTISRVDREKLDEYLTAIRDAEQRLQGLKRWQNVNKPTLQASPFEDKEKDDDGYEFYVPILFDLFHLAFLSDSSRVVTLNYAIHNNRIPLPGVTSGYHSLSHHGRRPDALAQLQIIEGFYLEQVARFIDKLKDSQSMGGTMFDETMVFFGSALSDAARHSNRNLPIMIAGGGFKHKGHYNAITSHKRQTPLNNLFTTMLQNFGVEIEKYNDASGDLSHILTQSSSFKTNMKFRTLWGIVCASWLAASALASEYQPIIPFLNEYCISCHGPDEQEGYVRLDDVRKIDGALWVEIFHQIDQGDMPPRKAEQPPAALRESINELIMAVSYDDRFTITTGYRRLNKREYHNTVVDLLGLSEELFNPSADIYPDEIEESFDTNAENLEISNELLLEFLRSAEKSLRTAIFTSETEKPEVSTITLPAGRLGSTGQFSSSNKQAAATMVRDGTIIVKNGSQVIQQTGTYRIKVSAMGRNRANYPRFKKPQPGEPFRMELGVHYQGNTKFYQKFEVQEDGFDAYEGEVWLEKGASPFVSFTNGQFKPRNIFRKLNQRVPMPALVVNEMTIEGPLDVEWPPSTYKTTFQIKDRAPNFASSADRRVILRNFVSRAYRRPVTEKELEGYMIYMNQQHAKADDWREAVIRTFAAVMGSNDFLYIKEDLGRLEPFQLASRLSYFLWSSMPDAELFRLASTGELTDPEVYREQIKRMFFDPKTENFITGFGSQWLSLTKLGEMRPDIGRKAYLDYYKYRAEDAMRQETLLYIKHVLLQNQPIGDFLDSDYTFLNAGLAKIYGLPFEGGAEHVLYKLPENSTRGGLLGHGSIHAVTSNGVETLPVTRGHWVLDELMGTPPPPPPAEVPALVADLTGLVSPRAQLARHSEDPACFKCHQHMDPLGLTLEAFDIIGRDRTSYGRGNPIDTSGELFGQQFDDVRGLRKVLKGKEQLFAEGLVTKIAEYAKGRTLNRKDLDIVDEIVSRAKAYDYRFMNIMRDILVSDLILNR